MAQRGGKRPGAGRKPTAFKRVIHDTPVQAAEKKIAARLPWLVDKLMELAEGVHEEKQVGEGTTLVYKQPPDRQACQYLIDRILGKPMLPVEQSGQVDHKVESVETIRRAIGVVA